LQLNFDFPLKLLLIANSIGLVEQNQQIDSKTSKFVINEIFEAFFDNLLMLCRIMEIYRSISFLGKLQGMVDVLNQVI